MQSQSSTVAKTETIIVKIGTSGLSKENGEPDEELLHNLVGEITELKKEGHRVILLTSGAVGIGKAIARERGFDLSGFDEILQAQMAAGIGQPVLMGLYSRLFLEHGITVSQLLTEKAHFANGNGETDVGAPASLELTKPNINLANYLNGNFRLPQVITIGNENDPAAIRELKFSDNDELTGFVAIMAKADRVISLSSTPGVCKSGHDLCEENVIPIVDFADETTLPGDTDGKSPSGLGGMESKLKIAKILAEKGIQVHIASSSAPKVIARIMRDETVGTKLVFGLEGNNRPQTSFEQGTGFPALSR
jgi:glutamate 5-kinase